MLMPRWSHLRCW